MMRRWRIVLAGSCALALAGGLALSVHWSWRDATSTASHMVVALNQLGLVGWLGVTALQVVIAVSGILPASVLGVAAGAAYGTMLGFALVAVGTLIGSALAFAVSRSIFRPFVEKMMKSRARLREFDRRISTDGWKLACLLRVSPVMPFMATSYMLGLSAISFRSYMIGTCAALPALFLYVLLGAIVHAGIADASPEATAIQECLVGLGIAATLALALLIARISRRGAGSA